MRDNEGGTTTTDSKTAGFKGVIMRVAPLNSGLTVMILLCLLKS